ncbi:MAG TPA: hypothetical protein VM260_22070, partial [Pirellula sp.]|nr:hypothetical protein [Pirellula sp.]
MDTKQVNDALDKLFQHQRIIFWNDPDREFVGFIDEIKNRFTTDNTNNTDFELSHTKHSSSVPSMSSVVKSVRVIRMDQTGALDAKLQIERNDPNGKFLIYSPAEEPNFDDDWLLDIRLYSHNFRADRASIMLEELGLQTQSLADHLKKRQKFCDSKDRLQKLKAIVVTEDQADDLDRKMLAVTVKADQSELYNILRTLLHYYADVDDIDLRQPIPIWEQIEKFDLAEPFWRFIKKAFGYTEESPNLENLLIRLLVTDFVQHLHGKAPSLEHLVLPQSGRANAIVCLAQWRDSASKGSSYDQLSKYVALRINLPDQLHSFDIDNLIDVQTFMDVETEIARNLKERVLT